MRPAVQFSRREFHVNAEPVVAGSRVALERSARTVVLDKGRIVYDGASERLRADPEYLESLVAAQ